MVKKCTLLLVACLICSIACDSKKGGGDSDGGVDGGPDYTPIVAAVGTVGTSPLDCADAYTLPEQFTGAQGLGHHGWTLEDLTFTLAWSMGNRFESLWISNNTNSAPSLRTNPWLVPEAGYCYRDQLAVSAVDSDVLLGAILSDITAFSHPWSTYDGLEKDTYTRTEYPLDHEGALVGALRGLALKENLFSGAPVAENLTDETAAGLIAATAGYPPELEQAIARLVLSVGEAYDLKREAISSGDAEAFERIFEVFKEDSYNTINNSFVSPDMAGITADMNNNAASFGLIDIYRAGLAVAQAVDECRQVLASSVPFESPGIDVVTPHGRILIDTTGDDTVYSAEQLEDAAIVIDFGGNDNYHGRFAATHEYWMSASVVIDATGNDLYTPETADIEATETTVFEAFAGEQGFTQGMGLFGVGVLADLAGDDVYTATVYSQGSGVFGVGILDDDDGHDIYKLGNAGQGAGYFGIGAVIDGAGNDYYGVYTMGQGAGKPFGHGLLLDVDGEDTYIGYYAEDEPELPGPGYNNYYNLTMAHPYNDGEKAHYMSVCQGVGWGYRGDWFADQTNWMGGMGALVDFGNGNDEHYADCMSMGQGFVYGFGFLYDDGGDDLYRTFWWGPAASAHMGVGLLIDEDGNDDIYVTHASGGFGYDCGVGWLVDNGGDDTYGGQFHYGRAYQNAMTFFVNDGGDDEYNAGGVLSDPPFGIVDTAVNFTNLFGLFLDLGNGNDIYNSTYTGVGNNAVWYSDPVTHNATDYPIDPDHQKSVGIDE